MNAINTNDPNYWPDLRTRVLNQKIVAATQAALVSFEDGTKNIKGTSIYADYVLDHVRVAQMAYTNLEMTVSPHAPLSESIRQQFMDACAKIAGMPEILDDPEDLTQTAAQERREAQEQLYGEQEIY